MGDESATTTSDILDLSKKCLKKVPKQDDPQNYRALILDDNELQKIDNIDSYSKIEKLSLSKNQLLRMYGVCRLHQLRELNLSFNGILTIEGLKELIHLTHLNLAGNNVKTIEHLNTNTKLEYLNLSENSIGNISDLSFLMCLKELYLHGNRLTHLRQCDKYLPSSLVTLTLAKNNISDLNEMCTLAGLRNLLDFTINDNPCVQMVTGKDGFDHRPFVLNWCMTLKSIDGFVVDPIESLKAEWLYSQGRGRQFRVGEQANLSRYLSSVCPLVGKALENENERKLRLILSKAQQHQRQLQEEISDNVNSSGNNSPSSARRKPSSRKNSPRSISRLSGYQASVDSMSNSYHGNTSSSSLITGSHETLTGIGITQMTTSLIENIQSDSIMTQSVDCAALSNLNGKRLNSVCSPEPSIRVKNGNSTPTASGGPLAAASKMVPVPESLMSPDVCPTFTTQRITVHSVGSSSQATKSIKSSTTSKVTRSTQLKRSNESSPTLSPRKSQITSRHTSSLKAPNSIDNTLPNKSKSLQNSVQATPTTGSSNMSSDDDSDEINIEKLKTIKSKAAQRKQEIEASSNVDTIKVNPSAEVSAVIIQKMWRGYATRQKNKELADKLLKKRTQEYIDKLTKDMEYTKSQLENERKIQQLQMQAINALWKKVSSMQSTTSVHRLNNTDMENAGNESKSTVTLDNSSATVVSDLAKTCSMLTNQVQQLQGSMHDILNCMSLFCGMPQETLRKVLNLSEHRDTAGTQTEIVAVHTPQVESIGNFPFKMRPSTLPLDHGDIGTTLNTDDDCSSKKDTTKEKLSDDNNEITSTLNQNIISVDMSDGKT